MERAGNSRDSAFAIIHRHLPRLTSNMKKILKQLLKTAKSQITGSSFREGKLSIGYYAISMMHEQGLDQNTLEDVFRHGRKADSFVKSYGTYSVSVTYRWDDRKQEYVITNCRKWQNKF